MTRDEDKVALKTFTMASMQLAANHFSEQLWPPAVKRLQVPFFFQFKFTSFFPAGRVSEAPFRLSFIKVCWDKSGAVQQAASHHLWMADRAGGGRLCSAARGGLLGKMRTNKELGVGVGGGCTLLNVMSSPLINTVWVPSWCVHWASNLLRIHNTLASSPGRLLSFWPSHSATEAPTARWTLNL